MSYILQALKESEARRGERKPADGDQVQAPAMEYAVKPDHRPKGKLWLSVALIVLLAGAGYLLLNMMDKNTVSVNGGPAVTDTEATVRQESVQGLSASREPDLSGVKLVLNPPSEHNLTTAGIETRTPDKKVPPAARIEPQSMNVAEMAEPVTKVEAVESVAPDPYASLPYLRQLPADVQRELPELRFSVHIYSPTRESSMVKLGDRMLHEGQRVTSDLSIEAIIQRAVVMRYREYRFKVPAL